MTISVLVPTFRRVHDLERCLGALQGLQRGADEVLLVVRDSDEATRDFLQSFEANGMPLKIVTVRVPGQVAALNAGLEAARGDIIAITDDDAAPHPDWLQRIEAHFAHDARVGAVGGRDWCRFSVPEGEYLVAGQASLVGRVQWFGRAVGNHHLEVDAPREVDFLKGVNMSYRRKAIGNKRFDTRLRGRGSEIGNDMAFGLAMRSDGWKLIYDPRVAVDHYPSVRRDEDDRFAFNAWAEQNIIHNETVALLGFLPGWKRWAFALWSVFVGTRAAPGWLQVPRLLWRRDPHALARWRAAYSGRRAGSRTFRRSVVASKSAAKVGHKP